MATVKVLRERGAKVVVEAHGEVLFAPGTELDRWKNRFSQVIRNRVADRAPRFNSSTKYPQRTYRPHRYPKHLDQTIRAATETKAHPGGGVFFVAVGSIAPYAIYVDQGTGVYGGDGAYEAKILPPFTYKGHTFYERRPGTPPVMIKGQPGQFFFKNGLDDAFTTMRLPATEVPGNIASLSSQVGIEFPENLWGQGNTSSGPTMDAKKELWRKWKREYYSNLRLQELQSQKAEETRQRNIANYEESKKASERRAKKDEDSIKEKNNRRAEGEKKRKEKEERDRERDRKFNEKAAINKANRENRLAAWAFRNKIAEMYPNAKVYFTELPSGLHIYRVYYETSDGSPYVIQFPSDD